MSVISDIPFLSFFLNSLVIFTFHIFRRSLISSPTFNLQLLDLYCYTRHVKKNLKIKKKYGFVLIRRRLFFIVIFPIFNLNIFGSFDHIFI